jgi:hypothetical protein
MNKSISDVAGTFSDEQQGIALVGYWDIEVHRADGRIERKTRKNLVTANGMNRIADLAIAANVVSAANYIVVGTNTGAPADTDTQAQVGEVTNGRKITVAKTQSREWMSLTCTWAGNTDGLTAIALDSAAIADFQSSSASTGIIFNRVNGMGVTLAASDFLNLTVRIRVGSHNQAHTT